MWWASHQGAGMVQLGKVQPWSRAVRARRWAGVKRRVLRPRSRISPLVPRRAGMMSASQAILRRVAAATGPVNTNAPAPVRISGPVLLSVSVPFFGSGPLLVAVSVVGQGLLVGLGRWGRRSW